MAVIGIPLDSDQLVLTRGRHFRWNFQNISKTGAPVPFPPGELFFEFVDLVPKVRWDFTITGDTASLAVAPELADTIPDRTGWHLVFRPEGVTSGGDPVGIGIVRRQG